MFNSQPRRPVREKYRGGGRISAIETQKTDAERVNIFIEGEYAFSLSELVAAENHLKVGTLLEPEQAEELQEADVYRQGLSTAMNWLARRPNSEAELRGKLRRRYPEAGEETIERVIARLKELNYLNDAEFARFWVESRAGGSPRGHLLIQQELKQKGVSKDKIERAVKKVLRARDTDDEEGRTVEERQALELARRRAPGLAAEDWAGFYRKLGGFLLRRGYDYTTVKQAVREAWRELKDESPGEDLDE